MSLKIICSTALFIGALAFNSSTALADDPKPAEIIAKHLDSIGPKEKRESLKTLMAIGISEFESTDPVVKGGGKAIVVSDPDDLFFVIGLNSREYPFEKIGYFHGDVVIPPIFAGQRGLLGNFVVNHSKMLTDGLFSGLLSLRWSLLSARPKGKFIAAGKKKLDGKTAYVLDYGESGGGSTEFTIRLYFESDTFRHIRSESRYELRAPRVVFGQPTRSGAGYRLVVETFADFKDVEGLTLPFSYKIDMESNSSTGAYRSKWGINVAQWSLNQKLAPGFFTFDVD